ncbi:hypothetical protein DE146DRAFT_42544 [Phaeosphaeria sp. MPI-PUGE-AT-0046c]|nr:hypothetical protein DE146DRAFT_42544 [Phaeosphaeria sp. MPI-PUGE-AT-0046c]
MRNSTRNPTSPRAFYSNRHRNSNQPRNSRRISNLERGLDEQREFTQRAWDEHQELHSAFRKLEREHRQLDKELVETQGENLKLQNEHRELTNIRNESDYERVRLTSTYNYIMHHGILPYAHENGLEYDDRSNDIRNSILLPFCEDALRAKQVKEELQASRIQVGNLLMQITSLQRQMLSQVDKTSEISDDHLKQDFRALVALVKSLGRSIRVTADMDVFAALPPDILHSNVASHHWQARARKKYYIESWIWSILFRGIFWTPFEMFNTAGRTLTANWDFLFGTNIYVDWPVPSSACETWRVDTVKQLVNQLGHKSGTEGPGGELCRTNEHVKNATLEAEVEQLRQLVASTLGSKLMALSTETDFSRIALIIDKSFDLAVTMGLQRSRLQVLWPSVGDPLDEMKMSCVPDPSGDELSEGTVAFIVSPGLVKWGDAHGKNYTERYDIVPSVVHVERAHIKEEPREVATFG